MRRLYLIRHAKAGDRRRFDGDDSLRPLNATGRGQAELLADELLGGTVLFEADLAIGRVVSSPAVRCFETVEPLASRAGLSVDSASWLAEGSDAGHALRQLTMLDEDVVAACTHGDVVWGVLEWLARGGVELQPRPDAQKASVWILDWPDAPAEGVPVRASYLGPPSPPR